MESDASSAMFYVDLYLDDVVDAHGTINVLHIGWVRAYVAGCAH